MLSVLDTGVFSLGKGIHPPPPHVWVVLFYIWASISISLDPFQQGHVAVLPSAGSLTSCWVASFFSLALSLSLSLALVEELRAKQAKHSEEKPQPSLPGYIWLCSKQRSLCQSTALFARRLFFSFSFRERKEFHRKKGSKERRGDDEGKSHQGLLQRPSKVGRESQGPLENQGENTDIIYADEWVWCGKVAQARNYGRATDRRDVFI